MTARPELAASERRALIGIALAAAALAALALPRLVGGAVFALAPGIHENLSLPRPDEVAPTIAALDRARWWGGAPKAEDYDALARRMAATGDQRQYLEEYLAHSPMNATRWLWLGETTADTAPPRALAAWRMSVFAGRTYPPVMENRVDLGLRLKPIMSEDDLALLADQIRLSFVLRPAHLQQVMSRPGNAAHRQYYATIIGTLSPTDIDDMVRIHAIH